MIESKEDLRRYMHQDQLALGMQRRRRPSVFGDEVWKFERQLRQTEYRVNCAKGKPSRMLAALSRLRYHRFCVKLGFHLPLNVFEEGLSIAHYGSLVVNSRAHVGKNCRIHAMVVIGATNGNSAAPVIGNNVYIGAGAKIIGEIRIADDVAIGAGAVVVRSIDEPGTTWGGVPARKLSDRDSRSNLCQDLFAEGQ